MHTDRPDDPPTGSCRSSGKRPWRAVDEIVRIGRALAVLLATLTSSTPTATTVLAGVAIVIAIGECA